MPAFDRATRSTDHPLAAFDRATRSTDHPVAAFDRATRSTRARELQTSAGVTTPAGGCNSRARRTGTAHVASGPRTSRRHRARASRTDRGTGHGLLAGGLDRTRRGLLDLGGRSALALRAVVLHGFVLP